MPCFQIAEPALLEHLPSPTLSKVLDSLSTRCMASNKKKGRTVDTAKEVNFLRVLELIQYVGMT